MKKRATWWCPKCHGSGRVPMPPGLVEVLSALRKHGPHCASGLARRMRTKLGATAINNRLERLRLQGRVWRWKSGKTYFYCAAGGKTGRKPSPPHLERSN